MRSPYVRVCDSFSISDPNARFAQNMVWPDTGRYPLLRFKFPQ